MLKHLIFCILKSKDQSHEYDRAAVYERNDEDNQKAWNTHTTCSEPLYISNTLITGSRGLNWEFIDEHLEISGKILSTYAFIFQRREL